MTIDDENRNINKIKNKKKYKNIEMCDISIKVYQKLT